MVCLYSRAVEALTGQSRISAIFPGMVRRFKTGKTICIYAPIRYYQVHRVVRQEHRSMLKEKISAFIEQIQSIDGVAACALVSRDGIIAGKQFDRDLNEPWFGALSATILASAESIGSIIRMKSAGSVTIQSEGMSIIIMGAGENFLIAAIISDSTQQITINAKMLAVAEKIREAM
jgi:predicted regulator of Ras-like GTPase activity (Roadblock/LC7/MglB family)